MGVMFRMRTFLLSKYKNDKKKSLRKSSLVTYTFPFSHVCFSYRKWKDKDEL